MLYLKCTSLCRSQNSDFLKVIYYYYYLDQTEILLKRQLGLFIYMYVVLFSQTRFVPRWPCAVDGTLKSKNQLTDSYYNFPTCNRIGHSLSPWRFFVERNGSHLEVFVKGCPPRSEILCLFAVEI